MERNEIVFVEFGEGISDERWMVFIVSDGYRNNGVGYVVEEDVRFGSFGRNFDVDNMVFELFGVVSFENRLMFGIRDNFF